MKHFRSQSSYHISQNGFLLDGLPLTDTSLTPTLTELANIFRKFEKAVKQKTRFSELRREIDELQYDGARVPFIMALLEREEPCVTAYVYMLCCYVGHTYVWGDGASVAKDTIPAPLAVPWVAAACVMGIPPVLTHSATDLYNYELIDEEHPFSLDNIRSIRTFTGDWSEQWFFLIVTAIERTSAELIKRTHGIPDLLEELNANEETVQRTGIQKLLELLSILRATLKSARTILHRMEDHCIPELFYNKLRPYIVGFGHTPALPNGVCFEGVSAAECVARQACLSEFLTESEDTPTYAHISDGCVAKCTGASGAQSSAIHVYDILLNVGETGMLSKFHADARKYMPVWHREFLYDITPFALELNHLMTELSSVDVHSDKHTHTYGYSENEWEQIREDIATLRCECVCEMSQFRQFHRNLVHRYVIKRVKGSEADIKSDLCQTHTDTNAKAGEKTGLFAWIINNITNIVGRAAQTYKSDTHIIDNFVGKGKPCKSNAGASDTHTHSDVTRTTKSATDKYTHSPSVSAHTATSHDLSEDNASVCTSVCGDTAALGVCMCGHALISCTCATQDKTHQQSLETQGTGGTNLMPFLTHCLDETNRVKDAAMLRQR